MHYLSYMYHIEWDLVHPYNYTSLLWSFHSYTSKSRNKFHSFNIFSIMVQPLSSNFDCCQVLSNVGVWFHFLTYYNILWSVFQHKFCRSLAVHAGWPQSEGGESDAPAESGGPPLWPPRFVAREHSCRALDFHRNQGLGTWNHIHHVSSSCHYMFWFYFLFDSTFSLILLFHIKIKELL